MYYKNKIRIKFVSWKYIIKNYKPGTATWTGNGCGTATWTGYGCGTCTGYGTGTCCCSTYDYANIYLFFCIKNY